MFQYTREIIINNQAFEYGAGYLKIPHVGLYKKENIAGAIKKMNPVDSSLAKLSLPTVDSTPDVTKFTVKIKLSTGDVDAILANYTTKFERGIVVELGKGAVAGDVLEAFKKAFTGLEEWPVELVKEGETYVIKAKTPYANLSMIKEELVYRECSISEMVQYTPEVVVESSKGTRPFGTYEHLIKDHRLPTFENRRIGALNEEEYPIPGAKYHLYELQMVADRNIGGFAVLGQKAQSVTTHRFWVRSDKDTEFAKGIAAITPAPAPISEPAPMAATYSRTSKKVD